MSFKSQRESLPSLSKGSPTLILSAVAVFFSVVLYGFAQFQAYQEKERLFPVVGWQILAKKSRQFHQKFGRVPDNAAELFKGTGDKQVPRISEDGHSIYARNYFYYFSKIDQNVVGIWAIPYGPRAEEASSYYVTIAAPKGERVWKGPAFERGDSDGSSFTPTPTVQQLAILGLTEQSSDLVQR